ncbi:hypothetical protein JCM14036_18120 [Desulfotomaculum defluvii]
MSGKTKPSFLKTVFYLAVAFCTYLVIFTNIEQLNEFYLSKSVVPALCLLGTIVFVSFIYGTAMSNILSLLGLESDH